MAISVDGLVVIPFAAATNVSTLTQLLPWTDFGPWPKTILFALVNLDAVNSVHFFLETSEDGVHADEQKEQNIYTAPLKQSSFEISDVVRTQYRLSAFSETPVFPVVQVQWKIIAAERVVPPGR